MRLPLELVLAHAALTSALAPAAFLTLEANQTAAEAQWTTSMMRSVEDALAEAHGLEEELAMQVQAPKSNAIVGSSLLREATIKSGMWPSARHHYRHSLMKLDLDVTLGCRLVLLLSDPATLDASHLCLWESEQSRDGTTDDAQLPNGAYGLARLRASQPTQARLERDQAETAFAAKHYEGNASEGFYPTTWQWLTAHRPKRRHLATDPETNAVRTKTPPSGNSSNSSSNTTRGASSSSVLTLDGLAASKTYAVFRAGTVQRGKRLYDDILATQARTIPGAVAAASLHDPVLGKLLWLVVWRSEKERDEGERMLASVLNVSNALEPMLAEPLGTERWPEAAIFWRSTTADGEE